MNTLISKIKAAYYKWRLEDAERELRILERDLDVFQGAFIEDEETWFPEAIASARGKAEEVREQYEKYC